jgi:hypothetical protein
MVGVGLLEYRGIVHRGRSERAGGDETDRRNAQPESCWWPRTADSKAIITDGDIRRHLLRGGRLDDKIQEMANYSPKFILEKDRGKSKELMRNGRYCPCDCQ